MKVVAVILLLVGQASGFSSGAQSMTCVDSNMTPRHGSTSSQAPPSPYNLEVSSNQYTPGGSLTVTLRGSQAFRGFLVLALPADNPNGANIGSLQVADNSQANMAQNVCGGGITHTSDFSGASPLNNNIVFTWTAPSTPSGDVQFYATVVQQFTTYWVKLPFAIVTEAGGPMTTMPMTTRMTTRAPRTFKPTTRPTARATRITTRRTPHPTMRTRPTHPRQRLPHQNTRRPTHRPTTARMMVTNPHPMAPIDTDTCDVSKACWRYETPSGVLTWKRRSDGAVDFEMSGKLENGQNYLALGLSPHPMMRDVSIIACTVDRHRSSRVEGFYAAGRNTPSYEATNPIRYAQAAVQTGNGGRVMICRFTYDNRVALQNLAKWKDLSGNLYAFIARGDYSPRRLHRHVQTPIISAAPYQFLQPAGVTMGVTEPTSRRTYSPFYIWPCRPTGSHTFTWCFRFNDMFYYAKRINPQTWS